MNKSIVAFAFFLLPIFAQAQDGVVEPVELKSPSLVAGIQTDVHLAVTYAFTGENGLNLLAGGGVVFARKYLGKHFALQVDLCKTISEKTFLYPYYYQVAPTHSISYQISSLDIPLNLQYHMGKTESRLRPYISLGLGYANITSLSYYNSWPEIQNNTKVIDNGVMMQVTEGITYRISKKLLFEQSLYYKIVHDIGNHRMGLRFGLGYTIM